MRGRSSRGSSSSETLFDLGDKTERRGYLNAEMEALMDLAMQGIAQLAAVQAAVLQPTLLEVAEVRARGQRRQAPAKPEKDMWGPPR